ETLSLRELALELGARDLARSENELRYGHGDHVSELNEVGDRVVGHGHRALVAESAAAEKTERVIDDVDGDVDDGAVVEPSRYVRISLDGARVRDDDRTLVAAER